MRRLLLLSLTVAVIGAVGSQSLAPKLAGKPSGGSGGTISLVMVADANGDGLPNYGDKITFAVSTPATTMPWVTLVCSQNGALVYKASNGIFPTSLGQNFTLASGAWTSGAADCTATLQNWDNYSKRGKITDLASITFHVNA